MKKISVLVLLAAILCNANINAQIVTTIAGTGVAGFSGDGGPATAAELHNAYSVAIDASGSIFIGDFQNHKIRRITPDGSINTIAGNGAIGYTGDGGPATAASLGNMTGLAVHSSGSLYVTDATTVGGNTIRRIDPLGIITTVAGSVSASYGGDGGPASAALLNGPGGIAVDATGNIYFCDGYNFRVRKISGAGIITTIAGTGVMGSSGDGFPATDAQINGPTHIAVDPAGNVYFTTRGGMIPGFYVRKVNTAGIISTIAGTGAAGYSGDGGPATAAAISGVAIAVDSYGNVYISDNSHHIRRISTSGIITTVAGTGIAGFSGDGCAAISAAFNTLNDIEFDASDNLIICDNANHRIRKMRPGNAPIFTGGPTQPLNVCRSTITAIDGLLSVTDVDGGQPIDWSLLVPPAHGVALATFSSTTTGGTTTTTGLTYTASSGYAGTDTFSVVATDCGNTADTTTIYVIIDTTTDAGTVTGTDSMCVAFSTPFSNPISGGTWSSSNVTVATVSIMGNVSGIAPGTATISYNVTNVCGTAAATHSIAVKPTLDCVSESTSVLPHENAMTVWPNPSHAGAINLKIFAATNEQAYIVISDVVGRRVLKFVAGTNDTIGIKMDAPPGLYFINAATTHGVYKEVIVIN